MFVVMCSKPSGVVGIQCNRTGQKADLWVYREKYGVCIYKKRIQKSELCGEKRCLLFLDFYASDQLLMCGATYHGNIVNFGNTPHKNVDCDNSWAI